MTVHHVVRIEAAHGAGRELLGGKGAGLARLMEAGLRVPPGFVVTTDVFRHAVDAGVLGEIDAVVAAIPPDATTDELDAAGARVRRYLAEVAIDERLAEAIRDAYRELGDDDDGVAVAVRSSSAAEDAAEHSFAGEHDTYLCVSGESELLQRVRNCWASLFTTRAMDYRRNAGLGGGASMAVVVQVMVPARAAGVFMTLNPENGDRSKVAVESVWGLGEPLVSGSATPDGFQLDKVTGEVVHRGVAVKPTELVRAPHGRGTASVEVAAERQQAPSLTDAELTELLRLARLVERHFGCPQDGEFAVGPGSAPDNVYLVQSRPETVWSRRTRPAASVGGSLMDSILSHLVPRAPTPP